MLSFGAEEICTWNRSIKGLSSRPTMVKSVSTTLIHLMTASEHGEHLKGHMLELITLITNMRQSASEALCEGDAFMHEFKDGTKCNKEDYLSHA
jgi:hypothetical protein